MRRGFPPSEVSVDETLVASIRAVLPAPVTRDEEDRMLVELVDGRFPDAYRHWALCLMATVERERQRADRAEGKGLPETCCDPRRIERDSAGNPVRWTITLSEYQRTNLLWLLCDVAGYDRKEAIVPCLQTGDWAGEIPNALRLNERGEMEESKTRPNAGVEGLRSVLQADRARIEALEAEVARLKAPSEEDTHG